MTQVIQVSMTHVLALTVVLLIILRLLRQDNRLPRRVAMLRLLICASVTVVFDLLWGLNFTHYWTSGHEWSSILSVGYHISIGVLCYACFVYSETVQQSTFVRHRLSQVTSLIPISLLALLVISSVWTGWVFRIDAEGHFSDGPLYWLYQVLAYNYLVFTGLTTFVRSVRKQFYDRQDVFRMLTVSVLPLMLSAVLQEAFRELQILCVGVAAGALLVYVSSLEQQISIDGLTGLNNRMHLIRYVGSRMRSRPRGKTLTFMMMDADDFKFINDTYGHLEGDLALTTIAEALRRTVSHREGCFVARYGGDEFSLVCETEQDEEITVIVRELRAHLDVLSRERGTRHPLKLSIGMAAYDGSQSIPDLIGAADAELYRIKPRRRAGSRAS